MRVGYLGITKTGNASRQMALVLFVWTCLAGFAWAKPPEGIEIKVDVGYNGYVALSRINPVIVELDNHSASTNLSGELILEYNGIEYTTPLNLPTPSKKRLYLYFPCDAWPPYLLLRIRTKEYSEQIELTENKFFKVLEKGDSSVIVLTKQDGSLGVLNGMPIVRLQRDLYANPNAVVTSGKVIVSYFDLDEVDVNPKFFNRADTIVLADIDYNQVSPLLAEALQACAAGGTSIVFSLGLNGAGVAQSPLAQLCPLQVEGTVQLDDLGSFGQKYGFRRNSTATFAVGTLQPGAKVDSWANGYPAIISNTFGGGTISALAFDFTQFPFKQDEGLTGVFSDCALKMEHSAGVDDWFVHPGPLDKVLSNLVESKPLAPGFVALFLVAYIVLIGPFNFFLLGKLKRKTLVWVTIPGLIVAFSYIGLFTGYMYRGTDNVISYFQELHIYPNSSFVPYQTVMLVFTAERTRYELEVPDRSAFLYADIPNLPDNYQFNPGRATNRMRGLASGKIDNSTQPIISTTQGKWTQKVYMYRGNMGLQANVTANLTAIREHEELRDLKGSFSLDLPFDLYNCYLFAPYYAKTNIGSLAGKGTYTLPDLLSNIRGEIGPDNYLASSIYEIANQQKSGSKQGLAYRDEVLLVGFSEDITILAEFDRPHKEHRLSMVVVHLPYKPIIPTLGIPEVSRSRLAGGSNFEPYSSYNSSYYGHHNNPYDETSNIYRISKDGYLEMEYELAGSISLNDRLLLDLFGAKTVVDRNEIQNMVPYASVYVDQGDGWAQLPMRSDSLRVDVPITGLSATNRNLLVRIVAKEDFIMPLPKASVY